ncbi:MAG: hypothetical protein ABFS02_04285, partial [Pseudomonadota bacterium]
MFSPLVDNIDFPGVGQAFVIERRTVEKTTGQVSTDTAYGLTSHSPETANAAQLLAFNRNHWIIENACHYILDWNWDEDCCTPHRPWTGKHHPSTSLRHRTHQVKKPRQCRRHPPQIAAQRPPRFRLSA